MPYILQIKLTLTFAPKPRTASRISPMRLKVNQHPDIALAIPNPLVLFPKTPPSSTKFHRNSQPITIFLQFSSNSITFA